jgi:hypothetical protein
VERGRAPGARGARGETRSDAALDRDGTHAAKATRMKNSLSAVRAMVLVSIGVAAAGCLTYRFKRYETVAELPAVERAKLASFDAYYLEKARKLTAFLARCPAENVTSQTITTRPLELAFDGANGSVVILGRTDAVDAVGTEGCGSRQVFHVMCGPSQSYSQIERNPCEVVASADAARTNDRNVQEQKQLDDQAAAAAAADDARRHQQK